MAKGNQYALLANIDGSLQEELRGIVNNETSDVTYLSAAEFVNVGKALKLLSTWSLYASTNNHAEFNRCTNLLAKLSMLLNRGNLEESPRVKLVYLEGKSVIISFLKELISPSYLKVIYRALNNNRPTVTNPATRILTNVAQYNNGFLAGQLAESFSFDLKILPKILTPISTAIDKDDSTVRATFVRFFITLSSNLNPMVRKDFLLDHSKVVNLIWKCLAESDSIKLITYVLDFITCKILDESAFKKSTKCKILNENFMHKIQLLFGRIDEDAEFAKTFSDFLKELTVDRKNGLVFYNDKPFHSQLKSSSSSGHIFVNNKNYYVNNKLLYTLLTTLKPWESNAQSLLVVQILTSCQELIPPYANWIVQTGGGNHEPSLSSWWIGLTYLYYNIFQIPLENFEGGDAKLLSEVICLAPLTRGALTKGLLSEKLFIRHLVVQIIAFQLKLAEKLLALEIENKGELRELILINLPETGSVLASLKEVIENHSEKKLLQLLLVMVLSKLEHLSPIQGMDSLSKIVTSEIQVVLDSPSGIELAKLDYYLSMGNDAFKWWNPTPQGNSFFTSLVRLSTTNLEDRSIFTDTFVSKNLNILKKLTSNTLLFNQELIVSPLHALIYSKPPKEVYSLLDETISRAVTQPYRFLDVSHKEFNDLSVFVVALFDQFKYNKNFEVSSKWLFEFSKYLVVVGEPEETLIKLIHSLEDTIPDFKQVVQKEKLFEILDFEASTNDSKSDAFVDYILSSQPEDPNRFPMSKFDLAGVLFRLKMLKNSSASEARIISLLNKFGNYLFSFVPQDKELTAFILSDRFLCEFFNTSQESSSISLIRLLINEIFLQLPSSVFDRANRFNEIVFDLVKLKPKSPAIEKLIGSVIWVLRDDQIQHLLGMVKDNSILLLFQEAVGRELRIPYESFASSLGQGDLTFVIKSGKIDFTYDLLKQEIHRIITTRSNEEYLEPLITTYAHFGVVEYLAQQSTQITDNELLLFIGNSIIDTLYEATDFYNRVIPVALASSTANAIPIITKGLQLGLISLVDCKVPESFDSNFAKYALEVFKQDDDSLHVWLQKSVLYITKKLAISSTISEKFRSFIQVIGKIIEYLGDKVTIWRIVPKAIINAQLEMILNHKLWVSDEGLLKYSSSLISTGLKSVVQFEKLLQMVLNNESMTLNGLPNVANFELRFYTVLVISFLFKLNPKANSTRLNMNKLLGLYLGSVRAEDLLLKQLLILLESHLNSSWALKITHWDVSEEISKDEIEVVGGGERLIEPENSGEFSINLHKNFIKNSNFSNINNEVPSSLFSDRMEERLIAIEKFSSHNKTFVDQSYDSSIYDPEFLMLLIINNEELVKFNQENNCVVDVKKLIDSNLLQFVVKSLSYASCRNILVTILTAILHTLSKEDYVYKDKNLYQVFVANILNSVHDIENIPGVLWHLHSTLVPILSNPGHILYERSFRYVLSHPKILPTYVPLFASISKSLSGDSELSEEDQHFKQVAWLLTTLADGINDTKDLQLLRFSGAIEWCLNINNSPYADTKVRWLINRFLYKMESVEQGADLLVSRFGAFANLEQQIFKRGDVPSLKALLEVTKEQTSINIEELAVRLGIALRLSKRIKEWTSDDTLNFVKRVHKSAIN